MIIERHQQVSTPSVYFNFDYSNQKTNEQNLDKEYIPYDYSFSTNKHEDPSALKNQMVPNVPIQCVFKTPPSYLRSHICKNLLEVTENKNNEFDLKMQKENPCNISVKLDTQEFFDEFDKNFVINFGDSPPKNDNVPELRRTFQSCPGMNNTKDSVNSKVDSNISEPIARNFLETHSPQNQEDLVQQSLQNEIPNQSVPVTSINSLINQQKENRFTNQVQKKSKLNYEIRKRIVLKNNEKIMSELQKRKHQNKSKIINHDNLLIITSAAWQRWTDLPKNRKVVGKINTSQPVNKYEKGVKKIESNIFASKQMLKQTLRSTTLDNWRKKSNWHKIQGDSKAKNKIQSLFQKPICMLR